MKDRTKAYIAGAAIIAAAFAAETITASAHGIAWEEAHGHPILTSVNESEFTQAEIELIAKCVQAEYGHGDEMDKRLVVSVILNRMESDLHDFRNMDTIEKVIKAPCQFAVADHFTLETLDAVYKELKERTNDQVLWFRAGSYSPWGSPLFSYHNHYFSGVTE